jgi:hypothetical protein
MTERKRKNKIKSPGHYAGGPVFQSTFFSVPFTYKSLIFDTRTNTCVVIVAAQSEAFAAAAEAAVVQALNKGEPTTKKPTRKKTTEEVIAGIHRIGDERTAPILFKSGTID